MELDRVIHLAALCGANFGLRVYGEPIQLRTSTFEDLNPGMTGDHETPRFRKDSEPRGFGLATFIGFLNELRNYISNLSFSRKLLFFGLLLSPILCILACIIIGILGYGSIGGGFLQWETLGEQPSEENTDEGISSGNWSYCAYTIFCILTFWLMILAAWFYFRNSTFELPGFSFCSFS